MTDLNPLGSEKLQGQDKITRILEIANYGNAKNDLNESTIRADYIIQLADSNYYGIVKEKVGYIIKKGLNESELEYVDRVENRKHYRSYSQAMRKINLIASELNRLFENDEGISLLGEKKKFTLKTPEPPAPEMSTDPLASDLGGEDLGGGDEFNFDTEAPEGGEEGLDMGFPDEEGIPSEEGDDETDPFKMIQKITGKLGQKLRAYDNRVGLTSEDIKYVLNSVISAVNLDTLTEEDKEGILSNFEEDEDDYGIDDTTELDIDASQDDMGFEPGLDATDELSESKVDKVLSKYFVISEEEKKNNKDKKIKNYLNDKIMNAATKKEIKRLSESIEQELASNFLIKDNGDAKFLGKSNLKNLVFEVGDKQIKISPDGEIL